MTTPTNWPNPERPGVPPNSDVSGWHWVRRLGELIAVKWDAPSKSWRSGNYSYYTGTDWVLNWEYHSPILTPAQIAEMLAAERDRCAKVVVNHSISPSPIDDPNPDAEWLNGCLSACYDEIRNLGSAP